MLRNYHMRVKGLECAIFSAYQCVFFRKTKCVFCKHYFFVDKVLWVDFG